MMMFSKLKLGLAVLLTLQVGRLRTRKKIFLGDGGDPEMVAAIRAHGNLIEFAPFCLLLIWLLSMPPIWIY